MKTIFLVIALTSWSAVGLCADLNALSLKITYKDTKSVPGKTVVRELKSFQDNEYWSKPTKIDLALEIKNESNESALFVSVTPEMYALLGKKPGSRFPKLKMGRSANDFQNVRELKSEMQGPTWVWNRTLASKPIREIKPGEKVRVEFNNLDIGIGYYPADYALLGIAIRVFVDLSEENDPNYADNVVDAVVMYGD